MVELENHYFTIPKKTFDQGKNIWLKPVAE